MYEPYNGEVAKDTTGYVKNLGYKETYLLFFKVGILCFGLRTMSVKQVTLDVRHKDFVLCVP